MLSAVLPAALITTLLPQARNGQTTSTFDLLIRALGRWQLNKKSPW
jgi:hypothetical protein